MDRSGRRTTHAWALVGGAAVGALAVYSIYKYYGRRVLPSIMKWALIVSCSKLWSEEETCQAIFEVVAVPSMHPCAPMWLCPDCLCLYYPVACSHRSPLLDRTPSMKRRRSCRCLRYQSGMQTPDRKPLSRAPHRRSQQ